MPIWSEILAELAGTQEQDRPPDFDGVRRKYLAKLHQQTSGEKASRRNVILYASGWLQKRGVQNVPPEWLSIDDEDMQGFMEVSHGLEGSDLDLILHSPGGSPEAAEAIVFYLRQRFSHIRVIVPQLALSAATMIACAADEIVLGSHSFMGPTDLQFTLPTPLGVRTVPAQAILDQFERARQDWADPTRQSVWSPMLHQYGPDLIMQSESALRLSRTLVKKWLKTYMFKEMDDEKRLRKANQISSWLSDHKNFMTHLRHISRTEIEGLGLMVTRLEDDQKFQDLVLSVYHAATHEFSNTSATKIIENHVGRAFIKYM